MRAPLEDTLRGKRRWAKVWARAKAEEQIMSIIDELRSEVPNHTLYHYTDGLAGPKILATKGLWATDIFYLDDTTEYQLALDLLEEEWNHFGDLASRVEHAPMFLMQLRSLLRESPRAKDLRVYVTSFSSTKDDRVAWDIYGKHGRGYCLGLDPSSLFEPMREQKFWLVRCQYRKSVQLELIHQFQVDAIANFKRTRDGFRRLQRSPLKAAQTAALAARLEFFQIAPMIKNSTWRVDKEWRLVSKPIKRRPLERNYISPPESGAHTTYKVPYVVFQLDNPKPFKFSKLIIGGGVDRGILDLNIKSGRFPIDAVAPEGVGYSKVPYRQFAPDFFDSDGFDDDEDDE